MNRKGLFIVFSLVAGTMSGYCQKSDASKSAPTKSTTLRVPDHEVDNIFLNRWSPRAISGESISDAQLHSLFEAARWAPSEYNLQPWHFVYAKRGTKSFDTFLDLLVDFNKMWADKAAVLVVVVSRHTFDGGQKARTHAFDTGAAWQNLALQASMNGLVAHGMGGFDYDKAKQVLNIPDDYQVQAMIAIGKPGKTEDLPTRMQESEKPSSRKKVQEFAFEGAFNRKK